MNTADLSITEKLNELFTEWKTAQEKDDKYKTYEYRAVNISSFAPDGIIDEQAYEDCENNEKILFIAKEGDAGGNSPKGSIHLAGDRFWLKQVVHGEKDYSATLFSNRLAMLCNARKKDDYININKSHDKLKLVAFMNLNKRGGYRYCDWSVLEAYTMNFSEYIRREIELINPSLIVCCGRGLEYLLRKYVFKDADKIPVLVEVYHPSYFRISDKEYLRLFEIAIKGVGSEKPNALTENRQISAPAKAEVPDNVRGIIFDTDAAYEPHATDEMLSPGAAVIMAFGSARKTLRYFNRGDYVYYYYKGVGIIAVGIIEDAPDSSEDVYERKVRLIVEPVKKNGEYIGVKADREFKGLATGRNGGFWLYGTTKKPYIYGKENNERAADEIRKKIAAAKN